MGQKVNPHGIRVGVIRDWSSRWYARDNVFGDTLVEDYKLRGYIKKALYDAGIAKIEIERTPAKLRIHLFCAKPGIVIGNKGAAIEKLRKDCEKLVNSGKAQKLDVNINVVEVKSPDKNAQLVAESIAAQLENRASFRRAMKQAIGRAMKAGAKGIKTQVSGRLGGAEIARSERYHEGTIPLQTLRADIDYGFAEADTTYGKLGVKVWIYAGEVLHERRARATEQPERRERRERSDRAERRERRDARPARQPREQREPRQAREPKEATEGGRA